MKLTSLLFVLLVGTALGLGALALAAPIAAGPSSQHSAQNQLALTDQQRSQIANLRAAFRDRVKNLDWRVTDEGHAPKTLQQTRELRIALREEIKEVLTEAQLNHMRAQRSACPRGSADTKPQSATLYL